MSRPLRLLWLIDSLNLGGAESLVPTFARALDPGRVELEICCLKTIGGNPFEPELAALRIPCVNLGARNLRDVRAFRSLLGLIRDREIDLVHAHLNDASIWAGLASRRTGTPWVSTLHVLPASNLWSREGMRQRLMLKVLRLGCSRVLAVSAALRDAYLEQKILRPEQVVVVHNGVAPSWFVEATEEEKRSTRRELDLPTEGKIVVTVSVLRRGKGLKVLLDAVDIVVRAEPDARFLVVGDGPLRGELADRCRKLGVDKYVQWTGLRHDVARLLTCGDVFALPTRYDAFPTVILEAMGSGLPVVASRVGGVPEIVESPETGLLVPPGDPGVLAQTLIELLGQPERRRTMGTVGRLRVLETFSTEKWVERLGQVYEEVVGERPLSSSAPRSENVGRA